MIGIWSHYARRKYIYGSNLAYQARRARGSNVWERYTPRRLPYSLTAALSVETHRCLTNCDPELLGLRHAAAFQPTGNIHACNSLLFRLSNFFYVATTSGFFSLIFFSLELFLLL